MDLEHLIFDPNPDQELDPDFKKQREGFFLSWAFNIGSKSDQEQDPDSRNKEKVLYLDHLISDPNPDPEQKLDFRNRKWVLDLEHLISDPDPEQDPDFRNRKWVLDLEHLILDPDPEQDPDFKKQRERFLDPEVLYWILFKIQMLRKFYSLVFSQYFLLINAHKYLNKFINLN